MCIFICAHRTVDNVDRPANSEYLSTGNYFNTPAACPTVCERRRETDKVHKITCSSSSYARSNAATRLVVGLLPCSGVGQGHRVGVGQGHRVGGTQEQGSCLASNYSLSCLLLTSPSSLFCPFLFSVRWLFLFSVLSLWCMQWVNATRTTCNRCYDCDSARDPCAWSKADYKVRKPNF